MMFTTATQTHDVTTTLTYHQQYFAVLGWQGTHELNKGFDFLVQIAEGKTSLLNKIVRICISASDGSLTQEFQGIVVQQSLKQSIVEIRIISCLSQLNNIHQSFLYTNQSIIDIAQKLWYQVGYNRSHLHLLLLQTYPTLKHCVQTSHETSGDFLTRLLAESGIFFWTVFDSNLSAELIMMADHNQAFLLRKTLYYLKSSGMTSDLPYIYQMLCSTKKTVNNVTVQTRSEYSAKYILEGQAIANNRSKFSKTYFGKYSSSDDATINYAKIYLQSEQATQKEFTIHSTDASLAPGQMLDINADEVESAYSGCYLVLSVTHYQNNAAINKKSENAAYYNVATLILASQAYRAPIPASIKFPITLRGKLNNLPQNLQDNYAWLDDDGKQSLTTVQISAENSQPLPRMQPHTGLGNHAFGIHLPLSEHTEVIAATINGNNEDLIILTSLYNDQNNPPVTQQNPTENILRSYAGNTLLINDAESQSHITLNTTAESNKVTFNHKKSAITCDSQQGGMSIRAAARLYYKSGSTMREKTAAQHQTIIGDEQQIKIAKNFQHYAKKNIYLGSLESLNQYAADNIQINSGENLLVNCGQQANLNIERDDFQCSIEQGHVSITASNQLSLISLGNGDIHIRNGNCGTQLSADGTINSYGENVLFQAEQITLNGQVNYASKISAPATPELPQTIPLSAPKPAPLHDTKTQCRYWINVQYAGNQRTVVTSEQFTITASADKTKQQTALGQLIGGKGFAILDNTAKAIAIDFKASEVIQLGQRVLSYPQSHIKLVDNDFVAATADNLPDIELAPGDKVAIITLLHPPIIINYRDNSNATLKPEQIDYFKSNGNNVMIFIHGYNVPAGNFPKAITDITLKDYKTKISYGDTLRTIYCSPEVLKKQYPCTDKITKNDQWYPELRSDETYDWVNGTDACNWFLHIEENLNSATGQFDHTDYQKYTRCLHISWPGDQGETNFRGAEDKADELAPQLAELLLNLHTAGITINIIAHSMGNRLLLGALQYLVEKEKRTDIVEHIFMWQAALPNTVLSDNPIEEDNTLDHRYSFPDAAKAVKKITVLFNENDDILKKWYHWFNKLDEAFLSGKKSINCFRHHVHISSCYVVNDKTFSALGLTGIVDQKIIDKLGSKLTLAKMTKYVDIPNISKGHSYMRIPNQNVMHYGYEYYIVSFMRGTQKLGLYDSSQFPGNHIQLPSTNGDKS